MKRLLFLLLILLSLKVAGQEVKQIWQTREIFDVPESVLYYNNNGNDVLFVSNIAGNPSEKDGNGFISMLSTFGKIIKLKWITGLNAPKGMAVFNGKLYVTDIDRIAIIDIDKSMIVKFVDVSGASFLNDMVFDGKGNLYISDMTANVIYRYSNGEISQWLSATSLLSNPNGMAFEKDMVLIGTSNGILSANPDTKKVDLLVENSGGVDGLIPLGNSHYVVSDWSGKIQIISPNTKPLILSNTTEQKINAADLGFIPDTRTILIPTFFDNRITAILLLNN